MAPASTQQIVARVRYADGTVRDVTPICYYDSSNPEIAEVDADGYVRFKSRGEVAVIAHYLNLVANIRLTHLVEVPGFAQAEVPRDNVVDRRSSPSSTGCGSARRSPAPTASSSAGSTSTSSASCPTPEEVARFLAEPEKTRRDRAIDDLLDRPEFYDFWALKFADILRSNGRLIQSKGAYAFHRWIRSSLEQRRPDGPVRPRAADGRGLDVQESGRELLPDQPRPRERRRDDGAALPRASASSAPSATITRSSAGRRTTITASRRSSRRSAARRGTCPRRRSSSSRARATSASRGPARR